MEMHTLDLNSQNIPKTIASFLVIGPNGPVLVETGPGATLERLTSQIAIHGYSPDAIKHVLVTHIHFDHAGAAGWWAQQGAQVYVHHRGANHLIDPSRLVASATRIYGDQMNILWGEMLPAPADKVTPVYDGDKLEVAGLCFQALETPGHANHHHVFQLEEIAFVGDAAGVRLPQTSLINLPAPPPEFDLEAWKQTIDRMLSENYTSMYLTHFDRVDDVIAHLKSMKKLLDDSVEFVRKRMQAEVDRDTIIKQYIDWNFQRAQKAGLSQARYHQYEIANPLFMSVDGIMRYWRKRTG